MAFISWFEAAEVKTPCRDMKASAEKLRAEADYAEQIARSATDSQKHELYQRLAAHSISDNWLTKLKR